MPPDPTQKIYLSDALASAKGPIERAKKKSLVVVRKDPKGGQPQIIPIDFEAILKRKDPKANIEILTGDVVYVDAEPEGRERRGNILERVLGIAGAFLGF
jgi:protein involved in polysaccharide export with SLBB domain